MTWPLPADDRVLTVSPLVDAMPVIAGTLICISLAVSVAFVVSGIAGLFRDERDRRW